MSRDCPVCGHDATSHREAGCAVVTSPEGADPYTLCGCTSFPFNMTCPSCGERFVCPLDHDEAHFCFSCHDQHVHDDANAGFSALAEAIRATVPGVEVQGAHNTGGYVMCLFVAFKILPSPKVGTILFSAKAENIGCSIEVDESGAGLMLWPSWKGEYGDDRFDLGWDTPGLADRMAQWLAATLPQVEAWANSLTYRVEPHDRYQTVEAYPWANPVPAITGTTVEEY